MLVTLEPAIEIARDHIAGMREITGHQCVDRGESSLDRLAHEDIVWPEVREGVFQLVFTSQHARRKRLPARRVGAVSNFEIQDCAHDQR